MDRGAWRATVYQTQLSDCELRVKAKLWKEKNNHQKDWVEVKCYLISLYSKFYNFILWRCNFFILYQFRKTSSRYLFCKWKPESPDVDVLNLTSRRWHPDEQGSEVVILLLGESSNSAIGKLWVILRRLGYNFKPYRHRDYGDWVSRSGMSNPLQSHGLKPTRLLCPWDSPRIMEWVAIPFSRWSSPPRDWNRVSCVAGRFFTVWDNFQTLYT